MFTDFLTVEGERLLTKSIAGSATITFTKMCLGDGAIDNGSQNITELDSTRITLDIYSVELKGKVIEITSVLKSTQVLEGFNLKEKGIYATDGTTEVLFIYGRTNISEWIENKENGVLEKTFRTVIQLSAEESPIITIQEGLYATSEDLDNAKEEILAAIGAGGSGNALITEISNKIGVTNNVAGSATSGTLMGKVNSLLSSPTGYVNNWNMSLKNNEIAVTKAGVYDLFNYTGRGVLEWTAGIMAYSTYSIMPSATIIVDGVATVENFDMTAVTNFSGKAFIVPIKIPFKKSIKIRYNFALNVSATLNFGGVLFTP